MNGFYEAALAAFRSGDNERARELSEQALSEARASGAAATEVDAINAAKKKNVAPRLREDVGRLHGEILLEIGRLAPAGNS